MTDIARLSERIRALELAHEGTVTGDHEDRIRALEHALWRRIAGGSTFGAGSALGIAELLRHLLGG